MATLTVRQGGLMRCCLKTLDEYSGPEEEGTVIYCQWCHGGIVVRDGEWRWLFPEGGTNDSGSE